MQKKISGCVLGNRPAATAKARPSCILPPPSPQHLQRSDLAGAVPEASPGLLVRQEGHAVVGPRGGHPGDAPVGAEDLAVQHRRQGQVIEHAADHPPHAVPPLVPKELLAGALEAVDGVDFLAQRRTGGVGAAVVEGGARLDTVRERRRAQGRRFVGGGRGGQGRCAALWDCTFRGFVRPFAASLNAQENAGVVLDPQKKNEQSQKSLTSQRRWSWRLLFWTPWVLGRPPPAPPPPCDIPSG